MTKLRRRMLEDLQLRGLAPKTQPSDLEAVRQLAHHYRRSPDQLSEAELRQYFLFLLHEKQVAERTFRLHLYGIRFFYELTLQRPWPVFELIRPRKRQTLPSVLRPQTVRSVLGLVEHPKAQRCLRMLDACGLRLTEGTQLPVSDIDAQRRLGQVRGDTGGKDRLVPMAPRVLEWLRAYWQRERSRLWLFPARRQPTPFSPTSLPKTCNAVVRQRGIPTEASIHTLRHPSATPYWNGACRCGSFRNCSATSARGPTARDRHLTPPTLDVVHATLPSRMADRSGDRRPVMPEIADIL